MSKTFSILVDDDSEVPGEVRDLFEVTDCLATMSMLFVPKDIRIMILQEQFGGEKDEDTEGKHGDIGSTSGAHNRHSVQEDSRTQLEDRSPGWWARKKERDGN